MLFCVPEPIPQAGYSQVSARVWLNPATLNLKAPNLKAPNLKAPYAPKVAAAPGFVDSATLLPQRGAQGAAARAQDASETQKPHKAQ